MPPLTVQGAAQACLPESAPHPHLKLRAAWEPWVDAAAAACSAYTSYPEHLALLPEGRPQASANGEAAHRIYQHPLLQEVLLGDAQDGTSPSVADMLEAGALQCAELPDLACI